MRTLIYKRTHPGDPDEKGRFGICDCMGRVRAWDFEAVIGVGGDKCPSGRSFLRESRRSLATFVDPLRCVGLGEGLVKLFARLPAQCLQIGALRVFSPDVWQYDGLVG